MKYRILQIITRLEKGGAPQALIDTIRRIPPDAFHIDLCAGQTDDPDLDIAKAVVQSGQPLISLPALRRNPHPVRDLIALWRLIGIIRAGRYHIVHTHTSKAGFLGRIAAWLCGVPVVIHSPHGTILDGYFSPVRTRFYAFLERLTAPLSHRIICLTAREIDQYLCAHIGKRRQYTYIYNGIDLQSFTPVQREETRRAFQIPDRAIACITIGRLVPVKGQADLLRAFQIVLKTHPDLYLLIVGEGELRTELESLSQALGMADRVIFTGWRTDIPALLSAADIFVLPSHNEGLGLVLIEAMACRLPAIATDVGGVPDVVIHGQTGLLVPVKAPEALAEAIAHLSSRPDLRHKMGQAGYRRALDHFSIQTTARKTETLYRELLGISP